MTVKIVKNIEFRSFISRSQTFQAKSLDFGVQGGSSGAFGQ